MRRAVLAALLALSLSSELVLAAEAHEAPDAYLPDPSVLPEGYELEAELATQTDHGLALEQWYVNDSEETDIHLIAVAAESDSGAGAACHLARERLRRDDFDVRMATADGLSGFVAERRLGLSYQRAAYLVSGQACLGVMTLTQREDHLAVPPEAPILHAMVIRSRAA
jgi:hypothetical protein